VPEQELTFSTFLWHQRHCKDHIAEWRGAL
jgi:hypothetical protein